MRVRLPRHATFANFVESMSETLTPLEYRQAFGGESEIENLHRFFWTWTMKEAYTKAVGLGLGFDFRRLEYDAEAGTLRVDGDTPIGWRFTKFTLSVGEDDYQGVVAEFTGGTEFGVIQEPVGSPPCLAQYGAVSFVEDALQRLAH
ncbi:hypothetical protein AX17_001382 [Amanita inopinata Kibby_2008]|nr:hypothetical protein AX17_001382 [Amanita inopinata Kibby_2008]